MFMCRKNKTTCDEDKKEKILKTLCPQALPSSCVQGRFANVLQVIPLSNKCHTCVNLKQEVLST